MEKLLSRNFLLEHLPDDDLKKLVSLAREQSFTKNQMIFAKGDPATGMMAVVSGSVRIVSYSPDGKEIVLRMANPGDVFGEIALIDGGERTAEARAQEKTTLMFLDREHFLPFLEANPRLCIDLLNVLCQRLRATSEQLEDFSFLDLRVRLAKGLLHMAEEKNGDKEGPVTLSLSQQLLAAMMGTTREAVNKRLRDWEDEGILSLGRGSIEVLNLGALRQIVD